MGDTAGFRNITIIGPPEQDASLRDVTLDAAGADEESKLSITLSNVVIRGQAMLNGPVCTMDNCIIHHGVEVGSLGAAAIRKCSISSRRIGVSVYGPVILEDNNFEGCHLAVCLYGNPAATLRRNTINGCDAAAIVLYATMHPEEGSALRLAPTIGSSNTTMKCARAFEVNIELACVGAIT